LLKIEIHQTGNVLDAVGVDSFDPKRKPNNLLAYDAIVALNAA
jgi:hypothetical protein